MNYNFLQKLLGLDKADKKTDELINKIALLERKISSTERTQEVPHAFPIPTKIDVLDKKDFAFNLPDPFNFSENLFSFEVVEKSLLHKNRIDGDAKSFLRNLASSIPELASNGILANSYRFVFPKGVSGAIMNLPLGQGTAVTDKAGKIIGHGGYISNMAIAAPLLVLNISSMIIKQHYLAKINENLNEIKATVAKLFELEFIKKNSQIESIISFLSRAQLEFEYLEHNKEYRNAYLANIIRINTEILELLSFYGKSLSLIETENTEQIRSHMKYYIALHNIFILGKLLEFKYAAEYNHFLLHNLKTAFEDLSYQSIDLLKKNQMDAFNTILKIEDSKSLYDVVVFKKTLKENRIGNLTSSKDIIVETMQKQRENLKVITEEITEFQQQLIRKKTFLIENGDLYEVID